MKKCAALPGHPRREFWERASARPAADTPPLGAAVTDNSELVARRARGEVDLMDLMGSSREGSGRVAR